jgi:hypothetical protein
MLGGASGVFSAVERADAINYAKRLALGVITQPGADIRQFAAGPATDTFTPAVFVNGQKSGNRTPQFGAHCVFRATFFFNNSHN